MVQLKRLGSLGLYAEEVLGETKRCVFFVPKNPTSAPALALDAALQAGGLLILTPSTDAFGTILAAGTRILGHVASPAAVAWYGPSDRPPETARRLEFDLSGRIRKCTADDFVEKAIGDVQRVRARLRWSRTPSITDAQLVVRGDALSLQCLPGAKPLRCMMEGVSYELARESLPGNVEELAEIRFDGTLQSGGWRFDIAASNSVAALRHFLPGMSYVYEADYGSLACESFSLCDLNAPQPIVGASSLQVAVNAYHTDPRGNYLELKSADKTPVSLVSNFTTRRGNQVKLTSSAVRMQFTPNPNVNSFMLTPTGIFGIEAPGASFDALRGTKTVDLLLGSAGTEYVTFATTPSDIELPHAIEFVPDCPSFASKISGGYELTPRATTAYVRPSWGPEASEHRMFSYVAQSEETPLFGLPEPSSHLFAQAVGLPFAPKPRSIDRAKGLMPWLPMRNAKRDTATRFDRVVTGAQRRRIAEGAQSSWVALGIEADDWAVTPQGFLVQVARDGRWQRIKVARGNDITVEFERPDRSTDWFLEQALSRPSSFLVATRSPSASNGRTELGKLQIGAKDWRLSCDFGSITAAGPGRRPILIAKFGPGTILDLLKNTEQWSLASVFNEYPSQAQADVAAAIKALETLSSGQSPLNSGANLPEAVWQAYGRLLAKLSDPSFNGIVVFNGESFLKELPGSVAALGSGELPEFPPLLVPMMGVDISRIDKDLSQMPSVFGAIHHYTKEEVKDPGAKGYALKLRNLDTHIENTTLTSFVAKAQLWTGSLMGDAMKGPTERPPIVEIEGHYNTKAAEGSEPQYIIQAVGAQKLEFSSPKYLQSIELTKLELISRRPAPDVVTGRISLRGSVGLGASLVEFCGIRSVEFEDLALTITQKGKNTSFGFDAGAVSVDWDSDADSAEKGWLKSFPLRLSGFRWSGMGSLGGQPDAGALRWPDIGFTGLDLDAIPGLTDLEMTAPSFDFGLEFDLNLGGFGGQTDAAKLLRAKFLLGWNDFRRGLPDLTRYGLGFRFEGGSTPLDVGIQGIFRLRAKSVTLKTYDQGRLIGFGLDEPRLDIAGYEIPKKATLQLAIVVEAQKPSTQPTWIFVSRDFEAMPLTLDYFAIGQNVRLHEDGVVPKDTRDAVTKSSQWVKDSFPNNLGQMRPAGPQGGKWGLAASGSLKNIVAFDLVFMDTVSMYGLRVEIPDEKPFFSADVLYRKISEDLGMFSVEIDPKLPSIEFGVGSLTLPVLGFDKLTNGGGGINLGFNGNDFSRAGTFQAIPFLGSLGVKAGQYTGLSSAFLLAGASAELVKRYEAIDLSPVHEVHLSFRLGFGKEIRQSIFRAGVSLTVYGLFQGALAKVNKPPAADNPIKQYIKIAGAAGVLLEIFGSVDFALISASVSIRVWVEVGFIVETWQPIEVYGEAGVSVYVKFVIARFKVFGRSFEIAIHYSFATTVRFGHTLGTRLGGNPPLGFQLDALEAPTTRPQPFVPIDWEALELDNGVVWTLPLVPSMDVVCGDAGGASVLPLLALHNPAPHGRDAQAAGHSAIDLALGLLRWALRLHLQTPAADPVTVTRKQMEALQARLRSAHGAPASRWMARDPGGSTTRPLDVVAIKRFFAKNCQFLLMNAKAAKARLVKDGHAPAGDTCDLQAIVFPWLREVEVHAVAQADGKTRLLRAFHETGYEIIKPDWEVRLKDALSKGRPEYPKENALLLADHEASAAVAAKKSALDLMLEDWTGAVIEALVGDALTLFPQTVDQQVPFPDIVAKLRERKDGVAPPLALQAVQRASSVLLHGLRVPAINGPQWKSVTALSGLDVTFSNGGADALHDDENVGLAVAGKPGWLNGAASLKIDPKAATKAGKLVASLASRELRLTVTLDEHQSNKDDDGKLAVVAGPGSKPVLLKASPNTAALVMPMPQRLRDEAKERGGRLKLKFRRFVSLADPGSTKEPTGSPSSSAISFAGLFSLRVRKVLPAIGSLPGLVEITGAGEEARRILRSWDDDASLAPHAFLFVVPGAKSAPPTLIGGGARFFTTNLSTEANPDSDQLRPAGGASPVLTDISDVLAMRQFLWMVSVVNDTGFFASIDADAWQALDQQLFSQSTVADAAVAWVRPVFDANGDGFVARGETLVVTLAQDFPGDLGCRIGVPDIADQVSAAPAGFVSLAVSRPYQENDPADPDDEVELLSRYVFLEHTVRVDGATRLTLDESPVMPPAAPEGLDLAASFEGQRATKLRYYVSVPLSKFLPATAVASGPQSSPYMFVGKDLDTYLSFGLRDASGHRFPGKIDTEWASKKVLFRNPLPQLGVLPGLTMTWAPVTKGILRAKLVFVKPDDFTAGEGLIGAWRDLKFNLDTRLVTLHAEVWLRDGAWRPSEKQVLDLDVRKTIGDWVELVLQKHAAPPIEIDLAVPAGEISAAVKDLPREVLVRLRLTRTAHVDLEASQVNKAVGQTVATLRPGAAKETKEDWQRFAEEMEQAYPDVYVARMSRGESGGASGSSVWIGNAETLAAPFEGEYGLQSYAPAPLAKQFRSGSALMLNERGEDAIDAPTRDASDIDLDLLLEQSLDMFEDVLGPFVSGKIAAYAPDAFTRIMNSKKSIVNSMTRRLRPIEARDLGIALPLQVTRRFHSLAAKDLRNIYKLGAIAYVTRPNAMASASTPRIYGTVSAGGSSSQVEWSKVRMPLQADSLGVVSATWKPDVRAASTLFPSTVVPSHVEWPWPESEGEEYVPSRWLELLSVRSRSERRIKLAADSVPLPLRRLPPTPKIYAHRASRGTSAPASIADLRRWTYQLDAGGPAELQDTIEVELDYVPRTTATTLDRTRTLFDALVGISHHRKVLAAYIALLKNDTVSTADVAMVAPYLANFLADLADRLASHPATPSRIANLAQTDTLTVNVGMPASDTELTYTLKTSGNRTAKVELALLDAVASSFVVVANPIFGPGKTLYRTSDEVHRARQGVGGLSGRRSTVRGLDILNQPVVMPSVRAFRNRNLGGVVVHDDFILESQKTKTSTELVAQLDQPSGLLLISTAGKTLADQLSAFAGQLFGNDGGKVSVDAVASLVIPMDAAGNQVFRSPLCALKGFRSDIAGSFAADFARWGDELWAAIGSAPVDPQTPPLGIELSVTVYADYAGDRPVLVLPHLWVDWRHLAPQEPRLIGLPVRSWANDHELADWLYWLTGGWQPDAARGPAEITALRRKVAKLLKSSPCYNGAPGDSGLALQERDGARMAAAWRECNEIALQNLRAVKLGTRPLGWFIAPWSVVSGEQGFRTLRQLLEGPLLPPVDWHLLTHGPIDSAWRAAHDPFGGRKVMLVEVLEGHPKTQLTERRQR